MDIGKKGMQSVGYGANGVLPSHLRNISSDAIRISFTGKHFNAKSLDVMSPTTHRIVNTEKYLVVPNAGFANQLLTFQACRTQDPTAEVKYGFFGFPKAPPTCITVESLLTRLPQICNSNYTGNNFKEVGDYLRKQYHKYIAKAKKQIKKGKISYDCLWYLFDQGNRFFSEIYRAQIVGSTVSLITYRQGSVQLPPSFEVQGEVIKSDGIKFYKENKTFQIFYYEGLRDIQDLKIQPMTSRAFEYLTARGKIFESVAIGNHYKQYDGFIFKKVGSFGDRKTYTKADGRIMVDIATFNRMNPAYTVFGTSGHTQASQDWQMRNPYGYMQPAQVNAQKEALSMTSLQEEHLYMTFPTVAGFSFSAKEWGEILITGISEIKFDDNAYDQLVLPEEKKRLIKALAVDNQYIFDEKQHSYKEELDKDAEEVEEERLRRRTKGERFTDIISGKGGGVIFLLHGNCGVGKTLTAEALAECLHTPLYSVSVGELGTETIDLEKRLQQILELASIWNAVVLIDEADIFLEARDSADVLRNAMVGIFLRKLEYHQGCLFLTTNRVQVFDQAFSSRISVALHYSDLDADARKLVWSNLLGAAATKYENAKLLPEENLKLLLHEDSVKKLASHDINGRQIRACLRLALALARREHTLLNVETIEKTIFMQHHFEEDFVQAHDRSKQKS
eukprot:TRINITY_DN11383_c0_g1_i1.p1 TRINITY_DN11383_c0_g1~~TRINITY_DN11383_c0_g1_i1.p1  ORF type:complete len:745 (-),score=138.80 TRINITY_DN11383_c0_g1_i1:227-2254(-)